MLSSCRDGTVKVMEIKQRCKMQETLPGHRKYWTEGKENNPMPATPHISLY